jgi:hypothetical protein
MLASAAKKLRWMGIDMHPRWRRRVAVIATYAIFAVLIVVAAAEIDDGTYFKAHHLLALWALTLPTAGWLFLSVFRPNGVVKRFDDAPPARSEKGYVILGCLDDWARYRYGAAGFEQATEEQQKELLRIYRVGNYRVRVKPKSEGQAAAEPWKLDEREIAERDRISRWALNRIGFFLSIAAGTTMSGRVPWLSSDVSTCLWSFALLALTLPQARVLWIEPDPRDSGELTLAKNQA